VRIIVTSDTHYQWERSATLDIFVAELVALDPDCVVVAGDVGETFSNYIEMLKLLSQLTCPRLILCGNHDLWAHNGINSEQLWYELLPKVTREYGAVWLETENWIMNDLGICGTIGWYDYSGADPSVNWTNDEYWTNKCEIVADGHYIDWHWNDIEFSGFIGNAFSNRLSSLESNPTVREVLVVTHVPPFAAAIEHRSYDADWAYGNAYFYNLTLGKRILSCKKVTRVVSGHTHIGKISVINYAHRAIEFYVVPADYGRPAYILLEYP
jgi:predicted phosphohydrolase